jgi:hypothetical protein
MQKWAFLTVLAYVILVAVLFIPAIVFFAFHIADSETGIPSDWLSLRAWQLWLYLVVVLLIQALLLLYPVKVSQEKLIPKRITWVQIFITSLMMSVLVIGITWSVIVVITGDDLLEEEETAFWISILYLLGWWILWSWVFYRFSKTTEPKDFFQRTMAWLIKGSILELLVAVPSHIIVRRRRDCCAPGITAGGIAAGLIIMLLAFGPGLYFLFQKRFERMRPRSKQKLEKSE